MSTKPKLVVADPSDSMAIRAHHELRANVAAQRELKLSQHRAAEVELALALAPSEQLAIAEARLAEAIKRRHLGEPQPDEHELQVDVDRLLTESASQVPNVRGIRGAVEELAKMIEQLDLEAAELRARQRDVQRAVLDDELARLAPKGEGAVAPFISWFIDVVARAKLRDLLKGRAQPDIAFYLRPKFALPAPNSAPFAEFTRNRDLGGEIESRMEELIRNLDIDRADLIFT